MIIAIIRDNDSEIISQALINGSFRVTRVASTGGFLRKGSTTLMIGVGDEKVDEAINIIRKNTTPAEEPNIKSATLFVLNVEHFSQI